MDAPVALLKFVAKASLNAVGGGVAGDFVVEVLPGIARDVWGWWGKDKNEAQRRADVQALAAVPSAEMSKAVKQAVAEVAADKPPEVQARLANFIHLVPAAIHLSLRRKEDPVGVTVPSSLPLQRAEDLIPFLPQRMPRFKPGDRPLPGVDREVVSLLGVGGFGEVWRARNPHVPNMPHVALKFCLDPGAREQLLKYEAGVLNRVLSEGARPGIVQLRQTYLSAELPCLEYEFIDGGDLASAIYGYQAKNGALTHEMATKIVLQLARAVGQVHRLSPPIVHRDLKPANVLVRKREGRTEFLINDFGIGGVVASQALVQTRSGGTSQPMLTALRGSHTPLYASPEQKRGDAADPRDDIHALGVIWYQLLVGDFSEGAPAGGAWRRALVQQGVPDKILDLLESCFEAKASHRPPDAGVVAEQIETNVKKRKEDEERERIERERREQEERELRERQEAERKKQEEEERQREEARLAAEKERGEREEAERQKEEQERLEKEEAARKLEVGPQPGVPSPALAQAAAAFAQDNFGAAISHCTQALKAVPPPLEAYRLRARAHAAKGNIDRALEDINAVIASPGASSGDFVERGWLVVQKGKTNKAVQDFTKALTLDRKCLAAYVARARAYVSLGSKELAFADFEAALKIDPQSTEVLSCRAEALLAHGASESALADFNEAIRLQPDNARHHVGRGRVYLALGQTAQAHGDFIQATHLDPKCAEAYFQRGIIHAQLRQDAQAVEDFNNALRLDWHLTHAYAHRARALAGLGQNARAEADFKRAIRYAPRDAMLYVDRGDLHASRGDQAAALDDYARAIKVDRNLAQAHLRRAIAYLRTGQYGKATSSFTRTLELNPEVAEARALRGLAYARKGQFDEALADAEECFRGNHNRAIAHQVRGLVGASRKAFDQALIDLSEAIRLEPDAAAFRADRGLVHYAQGNQDLAIADFKEAIKREPKEASHLNNRAKAYEKKGERDKAQADRDKAVRLDSAKRAGKKKEEPPPAADAAPVDEAVGTSETPQEPVSSALAVGGADAEHQDHEPRRREGSAASVTLSELIAASLLNPPLKLFRRYKGADLTATVLDNGTVEFGSKQNSTCSAAAEQARATVSGRPMNTNGWTFWRFTDTDGKPYELDMLRQRFINRATPASQSQTPPVSNAEPDRLAELRRAAEQGDADAQLTMGRACGSGDGVPRDDTEAVRWYRLAAEGGKAEAQCRLGWMLEKGKGTAQNLTEAIEWYTLAAQQGNAAARTRLDALKAQS